MLPFLRIVLEAIGVILLADFCAGFIHWLEDAYGRADFPITGRLITQPNIRHHREPRFFVHHSWLQSSWDLLLIHLALIVLTAAMHVLSWPIILFAIVGTNANQIHKWAHRTPRENGKIITFLHRWKIIQGTRHHARHHTDPKNSHYCTITVLVNPLLDQLRFWDALEWMIRHTLGVQRRVDPTVKTLALNSTSARVAALGMPAREKAAHTANKNRLLKEKDNRRVAANRQPA